MLIKLLLQACAVDPGAVSTNIYKDSRLFTRQPLKWLIENLYAPPRDGAAAVVHAASAPWQKCRNRGELHSSAVDPATYIAQPFDGLVSASCVLQGWGICLDGRGRERGEGALIQCLPCLIDCPLGVLDSYSESLF